KTIARKMYGAADVEFSIAAKKTIQNIEDLGLANLPICIAKTQKSLSDNPLLFGRPQGFIVSIREVELAAGAGFIIPIAGDIMRMPGLPSVPSSEHIDIDNDSNITGLA
ncbi:MAG: formate--tetrahydrofolate ligase, partial [Bacteroidales bacterium]|nr:formate--tetrahydrofolate ligase [Bacteroidales bacterium]